MNQANQERVIESKKLVRKTLTKIKILLFLLLIFFLCLVLKIPGKFFWLSGMIFSAGLVIFLRHYYLRCPSCGCSNLNNFGGSKGWFCKNCGEELAHNYKNDFDQR